MCRLRKASSTLRSELAALLYKFEPWLTVLVDGQGEDAIITVEMVARVQTFLALV